MNNTHQKQDLQEMQQQKARLCQSEQDLNTMMWTPYSPGPRCYHKEMMNSLRLSEMCMQNIGPRSEPIIVLVNEFKICTTLEFKIST